MTRLDTTPYWQESASAPRFPQLDEDLTVDVAIVGGGLVGITAAYLLAKAGRRVALIERDRCAQADTGHTTAHLTCVTDTRLTELVKVFGADHARAVWDGGLAAIAQIDEIVRTEEIACHFEWVTGYLHAPPGGAADELRREADQATALGFDAAFHDQIPLFGQPGVAFDGQARFHPREYLAALLTRVTDLGGRVFEHTNADEVVEQPLTVKAGDRAIRCDHVIVATHNPIVGKTSLLGATLLQTKLALYTSYAVGGRVAPGRVPDALFWDTADPYRYLRVESHRGFDFVIYGGEDHKTGQEADTAGCYTRLETSLRDLMPDLDVTHHWSGQVIETNDGLPFIGESAERQFIATGFGGNGMTFGTLGAMMARDRILGTANPWADLFDVGRTKILGGLWDYIKENKDYPYYLVRDRFAGSQGRSLRAVHRGQGKVLDLDGQRVAAYRASDGAVMLRSAICTHMACLVQWNDVERTWDCPCHGSRFAPDGRVLAGPAESPLSEIAASGSKARGAG